MTQRQASRQPRWFSASLAAYVTTKEKEKEKICLKNWMDRKIKLPTRVEKYGDTFPPVRLSCLVYIHSH